MTDFEREDLELQSVMGGRFHDMTKPVTEAKSTKVETTKKVEIPKVEEKPKADKPEWIPTKERTWMDCLMDCVKWFVIFGGLNWLIFYWELEGLMAESIATPCMWVCCALAGFGVGRNIWRECK